MGHFIFLLLFCCVGTTDTSLFDLAEAMVFRALSRAGLQPARVLVLLGVLGTIDKSADPLRLARLIPPERIVVFAVRLVKPTAQAGIGLGGALATVRVSLAVHRSVQAVNQVKEAPEVTGR